MLHPRSLRPLLLLGWLAAATSLGFPGGVSAAPTESQVIPDEEEARARLEATLTEVLADAGFDDGRVGVHVVDAATGAVLFDHNARTLLNPASNVKLFTAAAGLEVLGPEYRWRTEVWAEEGPDASGTIDGDLYLRGFGDPTFVTERMYRLVDDLWYRGIRRVTGDIVLDESFFDEVREGPGWEQEESDRAYIAPTGALSFNFNSAVIHVRPGTRPGAPARVTVDPLSPYFIIDNDVVTGSSRRRRRHTPSSEPVGDRQRIRVRGVEPLHGDGAMYYRRVDHPGLYFAHTFRDFMERRGVAFAKATGFREGTVPEDATLLERSVSHRLADVIVMLNKSSNNHIAEQLLKTLGAEVYGAPGTWAKGVAVVEQFLADEVGIPRGSYVMRNGSGLNDTNRFSAAQLTHLLRYVFQKFEIAPELVASLPVAGRDGTVRWRMDGTFASGVLRAKTGTLENVGALSGLVSTAEGQVLAFAILVNDQPGGYSRTVARIDAMAAAVAAYGRLPGSSPPERHSLTDFAVPPDPEERARAVVALGQARDTRNLKFLQAVLRTDPDPLVQAVAAQAILLTEPDLGRGLVVQALAPDPVLLERLLALGERPESVPVLGPVADLAAQGDPAALARLVALARVADGETVAPALAEVMVEVGRAAPGELLAALTEAERESATAALRLLVEGLADEEPGTHPFGLALTRAAAASPAGAAPRRSPAEVRRMMDTWTGLVRRDRPASGITPVSAPAQR